MEILAFSLLSYFPDPIRVGLGEAACQGEYTKSPRIQT
jgi:hypothetical protein